jgi:hypothetical protein
MILPFQAKFKDGTPTYFMQKIWFSIVDSLDGETRKIAMEEYGVYNRLYLNRFGKNWDSKPVSPKYHTIREDIHDRWHEGSLIHPVVFNRSKNQFQFAPTLVCKSVQKIEFKYDNPCSDYPTITIDGKILKVFNRDQYQIIDTLSKNDGFNSVKDFFAWFDHDYTGKIIHWTNLKY